MPIKVPLPEASEEEWRHRESMRRKAVAVGKDTPEYRWFQGKKVRGEREEDGLKTPDPADRMLSKRKWKYIVQQWRGALRVRYIEDRGGSTVSTQDPPMAADGDNASNATCEF